MAEKVPHPAVIDSTGMGKFSYWQLWQGYFVAICQ